MKKHKLTITLIEPTSRETVIHEGHYRFQFIAVVAAWWFGRHFQCLVRKRLFDLETSIQPL